MKHLLKLGILLLLLMLLVLPAEAATVDRGDCGDNLYWTLDDAGTLTITGTGPMDNWECFGSPWYDYEIKNLVLNKGMTTIGVFAFQNQHGITSVTIPNTVTTICEDGFFGCAYLTDSTLPDSLLTIEEGGFSSCVRLHEITFPKNLRYIGPTAFFGTRLDDVVIPDSVEYIGASAFSFTNWKENQPEGVVYAGKFAYTYKGERPDNITFREDTIGIVDGFFANYDGTIINLPPNLRYIGLGVFGACRKLESITIPAKVETIGARAFVSCTNLKVVEFKGDAPKIGEEAFEYLTLTVLYPAGNPTWTAEVMQDYAGHLTWIPQEQIAPVLFEIDVARMILGNSLEFQFGVAQTKIPDTTGYYAIIEKEWADGTTTQKTIPATQWGAAGQYWAIVYNGLAAKEMADQFHVTIYNSAGQAISTAKSDSVRSYVERAFSGQSTKGKTMLVDMLNYGAAAQEHFTYNTADLANNQLTVAQKNYGTKTAAATTNKLVKGTNYAGTRLSLQSNIQMQLAFNNMTRDMRAVYVYTDHNGNQRSVSVNGNQFISVSSRLAVELNQLVYADARSQVTVYIYNSSGKVISTTKDSIESYVNRSGATIPLYDALIKFTDSAKAYLH